MKWYNIVIISFLFLSLNAIAQDDSGNQYNLFNSKTYVKNPLDLRDPFKRKISKKKSQSQLKAKSHLDGVYTNQSGTLDNRSLESIRVVGVVLGTERRAMVKVIGDSAEKDNIFYLKEGMKIGENNAEVKAILPGGVVLVEKIRNVYDQDEYLETVIPVSND